MIRDRPSEPTRIRCDHIETVGWSGCVEPNARADERHVKESIQPDAWIGPLGSIEQVSVRVERRHPPAVWQQNGHPPSVLGRCNQ
jgi:hypothetical protein